MCIYAYKNAYICMYMSVYLYMHICMYSYTYSYKYEYAHTHLHTHTCINTYMYISHIHICIFLHVYVHASTRSHLSTLQIAQVHMVYTQTEHCNIQYVAVYCSTPDVHKHARMIFSSTLQLTATHCNTLQHIGTQRVHTS